MSSRCASSARRRKVRFRPLSLFEKINDAFARFDTVNVVHAPRGTVGSDGDAPAVSRADYRLSGAVEYRDGQTSVQFRLIDVGRG